MIRSLFALALAIGAAVPATAAVVRYDFAGNSFSYTQATACPTMSSCSSNDFFPSEDGRTEGWVAIDTALLGTGEVYVDASGYEVRYGGSGSGLGGDGSVSGGVAITGGGLPALAFGNDGANYYEVAFEPGQPGNRTSIFAQQKQVLAREFDADTGAVIHEFLRYTQIGVYIYDAPIELFGSLSLPAILDGFRAEVSAVYADQQFYYDPFGNMTALFATTRQTSVVVDVLSRSGGPDPVPEPATLGLLAAGMLALAGRRRRRAA
ncbi:MAG: PEP-CTERM sorting domain-containing protein [Sphingomonadaceae bacterium]|nr:PEP-CTERM sorting domain-containing protein [Sphingomonadaceae bacterium]